MHICTCIPESRIEVSVFFPSWWHDLCYAGWKADDDDGNNIDWNYDDGGDEGGDEGGDDVDDDYDDEDDGGDIYIMVKCLSVCLSVTKNDHFL